MNAPSNRRTVSVMALVGWIAPIAALGYVAWHLLSPAAGTPVGASLSLEETLGGTDTAGYALALEPRPFEFPADHGPHPDFRSEWWYLTGNLDTPDGRRFGYQLTLFRTALSPDSVERESAWATRQAWMGHFAITDAREERFFAFERFARGAVGLALAVPLPFEVRLENWSIASLAPPGFFPVAVRASEGDTSVELRLDAGKPLVLNGDDGLSRKGPGRGNASYYYAFTRLPTSGSITIEGRTHHVSGLTWIDREWSTSALAPGVTGWDWFAIQLDDLSELMVYRLRRDDGSTDPFSAGTFVSADGSVTPLDPADFTIESTADWTSPVDDTSYPNRWTLRVAPLDLVLDVVPVVAGQEHTHSFRYWEGAVDAAGARAGRPVRGRGYVELTGYARASGGTRAAPGR